MKKPDRPLPGVLRAISDEAVVRALASGARMTRAQLATATHLSKPTVTDAVRRLEEKGLLVDTGERTSGRGGVGTFYALDPAANAALAVVVAPGGVVVEAVDASGSRLTRVERALERPASPAEVRRLLASAARSAARALPDGRAACAAVSAADPVDRATGRLVHLPDAPFLVGDLDPARVLSPHVHGPVVVDNDVNWAAQHEQSSRRAEGRDADDFVYLFLGEGVGAAVVADGELRRGHAGLAGELAHVLTAGPGGRAMPFTEVFARLDLRRPGSTALDGDAVTGALSRTRSRDLLAGAVAGVIAATVALCDPAAVVLAGPWGAEPALVGAVRGVVDASARPVVVEPAGDPVAGAQGGVRAAAVRSLVDRLADAARA